MVALREATDADLDSICALGEEINAIRHQAFSAVFAGPGSPEGDRAHWGGSIGKTDSPILKVWAFNEPALAMYRELGNDVRAHQLAKALTR